MIQIFHPCFIIKWLQKLRMIKSLSLIEFQFKTTITHLYLHPGATSLDYLWLANYVVLTKSLGQPIIGRPWRSYAFRVAFAYNYLSIPYSIVHQNIFAYLFRSRSSTFGVHSGNLKMWNQHFWQPFGVFRAC